jgi:hypothetical protein
LGLPPDTRYLRLGGNKSVKDICLLKDISGERDVCQLEQIFGDKPVFRELPFDVLKRSVREKIKRTYSIRVPRKGELGDIYSKKNMAEFRRVGRVITGKDSEKYIQ